MTEKEANGAEAILSARGIVNQFGKQKVHDGVSFEVRRGEILGIAGGSGSGKTVLLRTLTGLHRPTAGEVVVEGKPIDSIDDAHKAALIPRRCHGDQGHADRPRVR